MQPADSFSNNTARSRRTRLWIVAAMSVLWTSGASAEPPRELHAGTTVEAYVAWSGGTLVPARNLEIDGKRMACAALPTVLDSGYRDFGAAYPEFLVLNPNLFVGLATPVKLWIFSHECAHHTVGRDEATADCVAVQRGRRDGWLTPAGLAQVCDFMRPARADTTHFSGAQRCELMRQCFSDSKAKSPPATAD
jgi:hypothetical protein